MQLCTKRQFRCPGASTFNKCVKRDSNTISFKLYMQDFAHNYEAKSINTLFHKENVKRKIMKQTYFAKGMSFFHRDASFGETYAASIKKFMALSSSPVSL